jgi:hypothetical protein
MAGSGGGGAALSKDASDKFTGRLERERNRGVLITTIAWHISCHFGRVPVRGEGSDAAGGKNTIRRAVAARYGDIVKHRAVALDVEYRFKVGQPVSGSMNSIL